MTRLAIVWTRPETVHDDAVRALAMAGFTPAAEDGTALLACVGAGRRGPGRSTAPWHIAAAQAAIVAGGGEASTPHITSRTRVALHLPVPSLDETLGVACCLRALASSRAGGRDTHSGESPEALIDVLLAMRDDAPPSMFLVDATLAPGRPEFDAPLLPRNIVLAGTDPVALDAAVARLMGIEPASLPLLSLAHGEGLGTRDLFHVDLVGDRDDLFKRPCIPWRTRSGGRFTRMLQTTVQGVTRFGRKTETETSPWHDLWRQESADKPVHPEAPRHA